MIMLLVAATAMALLLAGCGSSQSEDQGSEQEVGSSQQTPEPTTDERVVVHCADSGSTGGQQEEAGRGDVSNGKIVFTRSTDVASDIYVVDEEGAHETKLTCTKQVEEVPVWSPDGQKIVFVEVHSGDLYVINADGTNEARLTTLPSGYSEDATALGSPAWSPDGKRIAFIDANKYGESELDVINADGSGRRSLTNSPGLSQVAFPTWSPDSEKLAFSCPTDLCLSPRVRESLGFMS
jgi:dipeptidyl aminopeptidase/acylaminoacyl peptidase